MTEETGFASEDAPDLGPLTPDVRELVSRAAWVTITNPFHGSSWTGRVIACHDDPGVIIEQPDGVRICLPQSFTITECDPLEPAGLAAALANAERIISDRDADIASLMATVARLEAENAGLRDPRNVSVRRDWLRAALEDVVPSADHAHAIARLAGVLLAAERVTVAAGERPEVPEGDGKPEGAGERSGDRRAASGGAP